MVFDINSTDIAYTGTYQMCKIENKQKKRFSSHDTKRRICSIAITNVRNMQVLQTLNEERDAKFNFSRNMLSRLRKIAEI